MYDIAIVMLIAVGTVGGILAGRDMSITRIRYRPRVPIEKGKRQSVVLGPESVSMISVFEENTSRPNLQKAKCAGTDETKKLVLFDVEPQTAHLLGTAAEELQQHERAIRDFEKRIRRLEEESSQKTPDYPRRLKVPIVSRTVD